ncbi:MAG TPA: hypothetical protein VGH32_11660, partial [Pirellulales bacterium]
MASTKMMSPLERIAGKSPTVQSSAVPKAALPAAKQTAKRRWVIAAVAAVAVAGLAIWIIAHFGKDTRISDLADLRARLLDSSLTQQDRQGVQDEIRRIQQSLAPEIQKKAVDGAAAFMQLMSAHVKQVLALPDDQRMAAVDQDIERMRSMGTM